MDNVVRSGTLGMKWYHRYHQSYETKPTRSGRIGEEHGEASEWKNNKAYKKAIELSKKGRVGLPGSNEETDKYEREFDEYLNSKEYKKFYNTLTPSQLKEFDENLKLAARGTYMDTKTIKQINKMSKKNAANFSRREMGLTEERVIPAGTKMYRTTVDKNEAVDGPKYVSYMDVDRNLYKGGWVRKTGKSKASYENTYELKEDLRIPSNETVNEAISKVILKDKTLTREAVKSWENMLNKYGNTEQIFKDAEEKIKNPKKMTDLEKAKKELEMTKLIYIQLGIENSKYYTMTPEEYMKEYNNENSPKNIRKGLKEDYGTDKYSTYINNKVKELRNKPMEEATFTVAQTYGKNTNAKNKVIAELKKQGYNAMPDYASIGGIGSFNKEGIDPLIVFDGSNSLNKKKVTGVTGTPGSTAKMVAKAMPIMVLGAAGGIIFLNPGGLAKSFDSERMASANYSAWNKKANSKSNTWRGSFVSPFDLLRTNINDINLSIGDILSSGIV